MLNSENIYYICRLKSNGKFFSFPVKTEEECRQFSYASAIGYKIGLEHNGGDASDIGIENFEIVEVVIQITQVLEIEGT